MWVCVFVCSVQQSIDLFLITLVRLWLDCNGFTIRSVKKNKNKTNNSIRSDDYQIFLWMFLSTFLISLKKKWIDLTASHFNSPLKPKILISENYVEMWSAFRPFIPLTKLTCWKQWQYSYCALCLVKHPIIINLLYCTGGTACWQSGDFFFSFLFCQLSSNACFSKSTSMILLFFSSSSFSFTYTKTTYGYSLI